MKRESFVFYASFYNAIKEIPNENQLKVYQAITNFALTGEEPTDLNGIEKAVFILVKPQIIANNQRYINGCGGGRPKKEEKTKKKNTKKTNGYESKKPNRNQAETEKEPNENENVNVNDNVNENVNDNNTEQPKQQVAIVPKKTPQQRIFDYFANKYKALTGFKYKSRSSDFINLVKLLKDYKEEEIIQKIEWLEVGCVNRVFWFAKESGINSFTIGKLYSQWNEILPQLTEEQRRQKEEQEKEERIKQQVFENLRKRKEEESAVSDRRTKAISID